MNNNNTENKICQSETPDNEVKTRFSPKKKLSELLAQSYYRLGYENKASRVSECATFLEYEKSLEAYPKKPAPDRLPLVDTAGQALGTLNVFRLRLANFCKDRLCPMCSWRRSLKIFGQVSQIMDVIENDYSFIFLTLTCRNVSADELPSTVEHLQTSWERLRHNRRFKSIVKGYFKALEVTHTDIINDTYHPHYHCIIAVNNSYFTDKQYLNQREWTFIWQDALQCDYTPIVDVRKCKPKELIQDGDKAVKSIASAVAEASKYSVKSADYIITDDEQRTDEAVNALGSALSGRRLCSFGGVFEDIRKKLKLDDCIDGDLIHTDNEKMRSDVAVQIFRYGWSCGAYKLIEVKTDVTVDCDE